MSSDLHEAGQLCCYIVAELNKCYLKQLAIQSTDCITKLNVSKEKGVQT